MAVGAHRGSTAGPSIALEDTGKATVACSLVTGATADAISSLAGLLSGAGTIGANRTPATSARARAGHTGLHILAVQAARTRTTRLRLVVSQGAVGLLGCLGDGANGSIAAGARHLATLKSSPHQVIEGRSTSAGREVLRTLVLGGGLGLELLNGRGPTRLADRVLTRACLTRSVAAVQGRHGEVGGSRASRLGSLLVQETREHQRVGLLMSSAEGVGGRWGKRSVVLNEGRLVASGRSRVAVDVLRRVAMGRDLQAGSRARALLLLRLLELVKELVAQLASLVNVISLLTSSRVDVGVDSRLLLLSGQGSLLLLQQLLLVQSLVCLLSIQVHGIQLLLSRSQVVKLLLEHLALLGKLHVLLDQASVQIGVHVTINNLLIDVDLRGSQNLLRSEMLLLLLSVAHHGRKVLGVSAVTRHRGLGTVVQKTILHTVERSPVP